MRPLYALLPDGGFVRKRLSSKGNPATAADVLKFCEAIGGLPPLESFELLRVYFYDARPATGVRTKPIDGSVVDLGATPVRARSDALLDTLALAPNVALRLGEVTCQGWKLGKKAQRNLPRHPRPIAANDLVPDLTQKGVDLRIGLDIARLSLRQMVRVIVVVTGDSDLVPALRFALFCLRWNRS